MYALILLVYLRITVPSTKAADGSHPQVGFGKAGASGESQVGRG